MCLFLYGRSLPKHPHDRPYRNKHTQICTPSLGKTALWPYSNGAVQIRVGLELADPFSEKALLFTDFSFVASPSQNSAPNRNPHFVSTEFKWTNYYSSCSPEEFCEYCFPSLPGNFALKNCGDFGWIFSGLRLPRNEARKVLEKFGENSEQNSGQNSWRKFEKFGKLSFCNFSDLTKYCNIRPSELKTLISHMSNKPRSTAKMALYTSVSTATAFSWTGPASIKIVPISWAFLLLWNWPISSADFLWKDRAPFWPFLGEGFWGNIRRPLAPLFWMRLFCLQLEASCLQWSFFTCSWQF